MKIKKSGDIQLDVEMKIKFLVWDAASTTIRDIFLLSNWRVRKGQTAKTYRKDKRIEHSREFGEKTHSTVHSVRVNVEKQDWTALLNYIDKD